MDIREIMHANVDCTELTQGKNTVIGYCRHGSESFSSLKYRKFLDKPN